MSYSPGSVLAHKYRVQSMIGSGGFAEVYLAEHLELRTLRALKVLRKDTLGLGSSDYRLFEERFQLEAQLGAMFDDPHIVRVYDFEREAGTLILVMEHCPGGSLADRLRMAQRKNEPLPLESVLRTGRDIAHGLAILHQKDIIHRDLKPSNILFDSQGRAKLGDLGLAQTPGGLSQRSLLGSLSPRHPGTPGYMSPEQEKTTEHLRPPSDVYALGEVLFEALTGRMLQNLKPGTRLSSLRADVPGWLDELLVRMMQKDSEQRPWDGAEVLGLLEQGVQEEASRLQAAQERAAAEEKARQAAVENARRAAVERQQAEKERLAAAHRAAMEAEARRQLEAEQKTRWELEKKEAVQKAQREAEAQRQQIPAQKHPVEHNRTPENGPLTDKRERDILRSPILWIGVVLAGLVVFGLAAIGLVNLLAPEPSSPAQANTSTIVKETAAAVTDLPTRVVMNTAPPNPTATRTQRPTALPTPTENPKIPLASAPLGGTRTSPVDGMELVYIPAGEFQMGCDLAHNGVYDCSKDELPLHTVYLDAYYIDKTEVSNAQYEQCVADGACDAPNDKSSYSQSAYYGNTSYDNYPVINVSWEDASKYCSWAGRELPTEAQWEKAARGESVRAYPWGDASPTCDLLNGYVDGYCVGDTTAVGSYAGGASPYGVLDMAGNVWEWVQDWYDGDYYSSLEKFINPTGPSTGTSRVIRGGGFNFGEDGLRSAVRYFSNPGNWGYDIGFRCAVPPAP